LLPLTPQSVCRTWSAQSSFTAIAFHIAQDAYYPTETAAYAHVLLPAAQWGEKTGTMTNSERMVTLCRAFRPPLGEAKADWQIFAEVGQRLGFTQQFQFTNAAEVYAEYVQLTRDRPCDMTGISHERLQTQGAIQWPCPDNTELESSTQNLKSKTQNLKDSTPTTAFLP
jgi:ferredoxin-nitrate reductase